MALLLDVRLSSLMFDRTGALPAPRTAATSTGHFRFSHARY